MDQKYHGRHFFEKIGKVMILRAFGPWNYESAVKFVDESKKYIDEWFPGTTWAMLAIGHGQEIYTPESVPVIEALHGWRVENGLSHIAFVHTQDFVQTQKITEYQFNQIYEADKAKKCQIKYFQNEEDAEIWLKDLGYLPEY